MEITVIVVFMEFRGIFYRLMELRPRRRVCAKQSQTASRAAGWRWPIVRNEARLRAGPLVDAGRIVRNEARLGRAAGWRWPIVRNEAKTTSRAAGWRWPIVPNEARLGAEKRWLAVAGLCQTKPDWEPDRWLAVADVRTKPDWQPGPLVGGGRTVPNEARLGRTAGWRRKVRNEATESSPQDGQAPT